MSIQLKELKHQVIVITGASSGIGLATAQEAAKRNAKVVLAARSKQALDRIVYGIRSEGGDAIAVACDVSDRAQVERLADQAIQKYGRIDTWVNNAGLGLWGKLDQTEEKDARRLFDINFWGVVNGSQVAITYLREKGGALINVGSEVSDAYTPLLGMYVATKHAVKGYTDSLRVEVEDVDQAPISITLIQPTAVDTPFPQHARNYTEYEPMLPQPTIEPADVAEAILEAAVSPIREKKVGKKAVLNVAMAKFLPSMADKMAAKQIDDMHYDEPPRCPSGILFQSSEELELVGQTHGPGGREP